MTQDSPITDEQLVAYLDGELSPGEREQIRQALASDERLAARLAAFQQTDALLRKSYPLAPIQALDPVRRRLEGPRRPAAPVRAPWLALAAGIGGLLLGWGLPGSPTSSSMLSAQTAKVLQTVASGESRAGVSVHASFALGDGRLCRHFSQAAPDSAGEGLACREGKAWNLLAWDATASGAPADGYAMAGAGALLDTVLQSLPEPRPLDAAEERAQLQR